MGIRDVTRYDGTVGVHTGPYDKKTPTQHVVERVRDLSRPLVTVHFLVYRTPDVAFGVEGGEEVFGRSYGTGETTKVSRYEQYGDVKTCTRRKSENGKGKSI